MKWCALFSCYPNYSRVAYKWVFLQNPAPHSLVFVDWSYLAGRIEILMKKFVSSLIRAFYGGSENSRKCLKTWKLPKFKLTIGLPLNKFFWKILLHIAWSLWIGHVWMWEVEFGPKKVFPVCYGHFTEGAKPPKIAPIDYGAETSTCQIQAMLIIAI